MFMIIALVPLLAAGVVLAWVWQWLDTRIGVVRCRRGYAVAGSQRRCPRCRGQIVNAGSCRWCRLSVRWVTRPVRTAARRLAVGPRGSSSSLLCHVLDLDGQTLEILAPVALPFQPGREATFVLDRRGRVRAVEIPSLGTGWPLPVRVAAGRSLLGLLGVAVIGGGAFAVIVASACLTLLWRARWLFSVLRIIGGPERPAALTYGPGLVTLGSGVALCLLGTVLTVVRRRKLLNRSARVLLASAY